MQQSRLFRFFIWLLLIFTVIWVGSKIEFIFRPLVILVTTLAFPIIAAGVFYYILRPVIALLEKWKIPRPLGILLVYLALAGGVTGLVLSIGPVLVDQFNSLVQGAPTLINDLQKATNEWQSNPYIARILQSEMVDIQELTDRISGSIGEISSSFGNYLFSILNVVTNVLVGIVLLPFILFFMLKDGKKLMPSLLSVVPRAHRKEGAKILEDMDDALSGFIQGQLIVSIFIGTFVYIWYVIIDLDYALILALIALFLNVVPFIGPIIGTAPGVIVGLIQSPLTALWVVLGVIVIQQIESNLVSPLVMGRKLDIHPLTIILLLLVASSLAGFLGLILAIPTYAVLKVIFTHTYRLIKLQQRGKHETNKS
ncbi:AI-2E family transporter [Guptibacillus hwajinpoensis]|uniref:AI-2E family transporter n=1 Tax=Guptibacillus hwajinpoensis TaxID=208199 RepID=UPI0024B338FC|nr:AI-2E family transporter [Pseudalkalibacillus hwajinpoensis]